jgi:cobalt-zinc-cadmium efflux system outer membrane protein
VPAHTWRQAIPLLIAAAAWGQNSVPQAKTMTWQAAQEEFRASNSTLQASAASVDEARAQEITAFLRPNPDLSFGLDQINPFSTNPYRPLSQSYAYWNISYLHERQRKRELRLETAQQGTAIAVSQKNDLERNLMFNLRDAFVRVLTQKAIVELTKDNLDYYDKLLKINTDRFNAGAIAHVDLQRLDLQRVQYESDLASANVNLRTAKIDLLQLLQDRTPVDSFDVTEEFDFNDSIPEAVQVHTIALDSRPDLKSAQQTVDQARTNYKLAVSNGSTDPTFGFAASHQPSPLNTYIGFSVDIPLRIFDRNQGEKARTNLDIGRSQKLLDANQVAVLHDVDSALATLQSTLVLLKSYKEKYLKEAEEVRSTMSYSYEHGAASLLDFLNAQNDYRATRLTYLNLVGSYKSASNQLNTAVGREVIK